MPDGNRNGLAGWRRTQRPAQPSASSPHPHRIIDRRAADHARRRKPRRVEAKRAEREGRPTSRSTVTSPDGKIRRRQGRSHHPTSRLRDAQSSATYRESRLDRPIGCQSKSRCQASRHSHPTRGKIYDSGYPVSLKGDLHFGRGLMICQRARWAPSPTRPGLARGASSSSRRSGKPEFGRERELSEIAARSRNFTASRCSSITEL